MKYLNFWLPNGDYWDACCRRSILDARCRRPKNREERVVNCRVEMLVVVGQETHEMREGCRLRRSNYERRGCREEGSLIAGKRCSYVWKRRSSGNKEWTVTGGHRTGCRQRNRRRSKAMSFTKGDLLTRTRKLVNGLAKAKPVWLKAMEKSPPPVFPRAEKKVERICLPEDAYVNKFYKKYPESLHEDPIKIRDFDPTPSRIFGCRVLELKEHGVREEDALDVADTEYRLQKKAKKKAYKRLKETARIRGTEPPPNPYLSAVKEVQAEEKKYVHDRFFNPRILEIADKLKEQQAAEMHDRGRAGGF